MDRRSNIWEIILYNESLPPYWKEIIMDTKVPAVMSPCHNLDVYSDYDEKKARLKIDELMKEKGDILEDLKSYLDLKDFYCTKKESKSRMEQMQKIQNKMGLLNNKLENLDSQIELYGTHKSGQTKKQHYHLIVNYGAGANKSMEQVQEDFCEPLNSYKFPSIVKTERGAVRYLCHMDHPAKYQYRIDEVTFFNGYFPGDYFELSNKDMDKLGIAILKFISDNDIRSYSDLELVTRCYRPWHKYVCSHTIFFDKLLQSRLDGGWIPEGKEFELQNKILDITSRSFSED